MKTLESLLIHAMNHAAVLKCCGWDYDDIEMLQYVWYFGL